MLLGETFQTFRSASTQCNYTIQPTDPGLVRPILKARNVLLKEKMYITNNADDILNNLIDQITLPQEVTVTVGVLELGIVQVYTDAIGPVHDTIMATEKYTDLTEAHHGIKEIFTDNIYKGATRYPTEDVRDFIELKLYQHNTTKDLVLVSNYKLTKPVQNKFGMLHNTSIPTDFNSLVLVGLLPAFNEEFKERLTPDEIAFFKLLTTPVKVYHTIDAARLYERIINQDPYRQMIKNYGIEKIRTKLIEEEERYLNNSIGDAMQAVQNFTEELARAELRLIHIQKDLAYYKAGDKSISASADYLVEHPYLFNIDTTGEGLNCYFRVPLSQWDTELAETILNGLEQTPERYNIDTHYLGNVKQFIKYILIDQVAKYWVIAFFRINLRNFTWEPQKLYWDSGRDFNTQLCNNMKAGVNPHLEYHNCTGSYRVQIDKALANKDLPGTIESILAPYKNWNLSDGTVQNKMFNFALPGLIDNNIPCIEYNGDMMDIKTFITTIEEANKHGK